jgi:PAS domain S-box-containing protein
LTPAAATEPVPSTPPLFDIFARIVGVFAWGYAIAVPVVFTLSGRDADQLLPVALWIAVPLHLLVILLFGALALTGAKHASSLWPLPWVFVAFGATSLAATYCWNVWRPALDREALSVEDGIYLLDYWILTGVYALLFVRAGGTFRSLRVWLDAATLIVVQMVAVWSFFLEPGFPNGLGANITPAATLAYTFTLASMMAMAVLLCMQVPDCRRRPEILLLVGAGVAEVVWELFWLASWLVDFEFVGPYFNYGDVLSFACVLSAIAALQAGAKRAAVAEDPERSLDSFLPALSALVAIGLVAGTLATSRRSHAWILVGLVALCALLLITRQRSARREVRLLHRQLAARAADARLMELVRRSTDLILVVDAARRISFASPAAQEMLGRSPAELQGEALAGALGAAHEAALARFLDRAFGQDEALPELELRLDGEGRERRVLKIQSANQLANPLINGVVLTVSDVTRQRLLERQVLDAAGRERARLSADIHDGLGQELTGISMLLHVAAIAPDPDAERQRRQLEGIVAQVNRTIGVARDLARGLSPLQVVRGSLGGALRRLALEMHASVPIRLHIERAFEEPVIDEFSAEHLYRIAQEAVVNAVRHSGCTHIDIDLCMLGGCLSLSIADDGRGMTRREEGDAGIGMRLMDYRARIVGGSLRTERGADGGTRVEVTMPLPLATAASG